MLSNFKFRYNASFTAEEKERNKQKMEERLKLEKEAERNKQKMEERLKLEKQFREEAEQIREEAKRNEKRMIHIQYQNKLKEILTKDIVLSYPYNTREYFALKNLISLKIEELDKFLRIKGLRFPYNDLDIYLKNPEFLCKAMEFKKQIEKLNDDLHEKRILRQKIRDEVFYGII